MATQGMAIKTFQTEKLFTEKIESKIEEMESDDVMTKKDDVAIQNGDTSPDSKSTIDQENTEETEIGDKSENVDKSEEKNEVSKKNEDEKTDEDPINSSKAEQDQIVESDPGKITEKSEKKPDESLNKKTSDEPPEKVLDEVLVEEKSSSNEKPDDKPAPDKEKAEDGPEDVTEASPISENSEEKSEEKTEEKPDESKASPISEKGDEKLEDKTEVKSDESSTSPSVQAAIEVEESDEDDEPLDMIVTKRTDNRGTTSNTNQVSDDEKPENDYIEDKKTEGPENKSEKSPEKSCEEKNETSLAQKKPRSALESICAKLNEKMKKEEVKNEEVKAENSKMDSEDFDEAKPEPKTLELTSEEKSELLEKKNDEIQKLKEQLKREKLERELIEKDQTDIGEKFEEKVEQFKKREFYRPHSTYRGILKEQLTKFEQRAKKLKVDDSDVHRIRKNVQTLSSNHSTMYNKLKEYCNESAELKKTLRKLTETAKRLGSLQELEKQTIGVNTDLLVEESGYRKLTTLRRLNIPKNVRYVDQNRIKVNSNPLKMININGNVQNIQSIPSSQGYSLNNGVVHVLNQNGQNQKNFVVVNSNQFTNQAGIQGAQKIVINSNQMMNSNMPQRFTQLNQNKIATTKPVTINVTKPNLIQSANQSQLSRPSSTYSSSNHGMSSPTVPQMNIPPASGQKRPRTPPKSNGGFVDLTDDEPAGKKLIQNGNIRNSESVQNRNIRQRYRGSSVSVQSEPGLVETIIGKVQLPQKPAPPRFDKDKIPEDAKSLPGKLKIDANFEGVSNMKLVWSFAEDSGHKLSDRADCASYELYVCTIKKADSVDSKRVWQRIGGKDIPGHRIPVKCSLKNFDRENDYIFLVRGKDLHGRVGEFSEFSLAKKSS